MDPETLALMAAMGGVEGFYDDDDVEGGEVGYADEVGLICDVTGMGAPEVGRLFKSKKKRRRFLGSIFGGPFGALGAMIKRRKEKKAQRRAATAALGAGGAMNAAALTNLAATLAPTKPSTRPNTIVPGYGRSVPLGLGFAALPAGGTVTLTTSVQRPIQPHRLVVGAGAPGLVQVTDIKIGVKSQIAGNDGIPAGAFEGTAEEINIEFDPASTGQTVSVEFLNLDGVNADTVQASFFGQTSEN